MDLCHTFIIIKASTLPGKKYKRMKIEVNPELISSEVSLNEISIQSYIYL